MEILYTIFLILFVCASPIFGFFLAKSTKEEQKYAKTYLSSAFVVVFAILFALILNITLSNIYLFLLFIIIGIIFSFFIKEYLFYLGIIFFSSLNNPDNLVFLISVFVFLLNIIIGIFYYNINQKLSKIKRQLIFFVMPIILYLSSLGTLLDTAALAPIGLGGVLGLMLKQKGNKAKLSSKKKR